MFIFMVIKLHKFRTIAKTAHIPEFVTYTVTNVNAYLQSGSMSSSKSAEMCSIAMLKMY